MSKSEKQRMYDIGTIILSCAISQRLSSYDYGLRGLIYQHIKANESHGSQMGLTKKYYDDKWNNFILVLREMGDWKHAEQLGVQVLAMRKKLLGPEHPDTLKSMGNLVDIYLCQGKQLVSDDTQPPTQPPTQFPTQLPPHRRLKVRPILK